MLNLQLPSTLYLGGRPYNQVTAIYHMAITAAAPLSVEEYSVAWGWSVAEAKIFILQVQQNSMLQLQQNASNEDWHNSCSYNINNINYNYNNNTSTSTSTDISTTVVVGIHDKLNLEKDTEIPFASDCDAALRKFFSESTRRSQSARDLLLYWILLYQQAGFQYSELLGKDLGAISGVVMDNNEEKAAAVLDWAFTSNHYRASWLRSKKVLSPASLLSRKKLASNYQLSIEAAQQINQTTTTTTSAPSPRFDAEGNLIK